METKNILTDIENQFSNIEAIRGNLIQAKKIQLHTGMEGFEDGDSYNIYRHTGGKPIGQRLGKDFQPANLHLFLDSIVQSVSECSQLDLSKLTYNEYKEGSKVSFEIPLPTAKIDSPMVGDIIESKVMFTTGYDGLTKYSVSYSTLRTWCSNGAKKWNNDIALSFKNTIGNQFKVALFCNEIMKAVNDNTDYIHTLNRLVTEKVTKKEIDIFVSKLTGYDLAEYKDMNTKRRNILDKINRDILIETNNTGLNKFSLLQGITRYTTHEMAGGNEEGWLFDTAGKLNQKAHQMLILS